MAFLGQEINVNDLPKGDNNFDPIPAGWYSATIAGAEVKPTKAGTGRYISVRFDITGPTHQGRVMFTNLNIQNPSPKAEEIGLQQLGSVLLAIGIAKIKDSDQLIGGNLQIKVTVKDDPQYGRPGNEVKAYRAIAGSMPPAPRPTATQPTQAAAPSTSPPWANK